MKTKGELVSDLELRFTKGKPSDDLELERDQIAFWLDIAANALLTDSISKQMAKREDINPFYISKSDYKTAASESIADVDISDERYSIDISDLKILPVRGFSRDYGIVRLQDEENKQLVPINYDDSDFYKNLCFAKPSDENMQWYREGSKIYIDGVDENIATYKKFRVFYIKTINSSSLTDSSEYPLTDDLLSIVVDVAEEIGRRQLMQPIDDLENNGQQ